MYIELKKAAEELRKAMSKSANQQMGYGHSPAPATGMQGNKMLPTPPPATAPGFAKMQPGMAPSPAAAANAPAPPQVTKMGADVTAFTDELLDLWGHAPLITS